jgi:hypothetical protein
MGERFYLSQLNKLGHCPGRIGRKKRMAWTDEQKAQAVELYEAGNPTPENSTEIVASIAEEMGQSINGVRMILTRAEVYVKKGVASVAKESTTTRVSKQGSQDALTAVITDAGQAADNDIISKLTGKAAVYFTTLISGILGTEEASE